jgi:hypothetical protein
METIWDVLRELIGIFGGGTKYDNAMAAIDAAEAAGTPLAASSSDETVQDSPEHSGTVQDIPEQSGTVQGGPEPAPVPEGGQA